MTINWLDKTVSSLSDKDDNWRDFQITLDETARQNFEKTLKELDHFVSERSQRISEVASTSDLFLRKYMVHVQQRELELRKISPDWDMRISDSDAMSILWNDAQLRLGAFLEKNHFSNLRFYGGIKELGALRGKLTTSQEAKKDNKIRPFMDDVWDVVRCRIIVEQSEDMRDLCQLLWEDFFEDVVRCRNYYYSPKIGREINPYRAVHFVIGDSRGQIFELQVQHRFREAVSMLDHAYVFKKDGLLDFEDEKQEYWMSAMGHAATILEAEELKSVLSLK